jgi:hypothetical protein
MNNMLHHTAFQYGPQTLYANGGPGPKPAPEIEPDPTGPEITPPIPPDVSIPDII